MNTANESSQPIRQSPDCHCLEAGYCATFDRKMMGRPYEICSGQSGLPPEKVASYRRTWQLQAALQGHESPHACDLRGPKIGTVGCQTCKNNTVQLPLYSCPLHGQCIQTPSSLKMLDEFIDATEIRKESPGRWICSNCRDRVAVKPRKTCDRLINLPGYTLNNSAIEFDGKIIMAYRLGWDNARIAICELAENGFVIGGPVVLPLKTGNAQEDPRLFVFQGRLHVAFTAVRCRKSGLTTDVAFARLKTSGGGYGVAEEFCPTYPGRNSWEKNWGFFEHDGQLYCVYSITPHRILRITAGGHKAELAYESEWSPPTICGELRGGASPVRVGDEFYSFFHGVAGQTKDRVYSAGLYTFEAKPPFRPSRSMRRQLMLPSQKDRPSAHMPHCVYPGGAYLSGHHWHIAYGYYDHECRMAQFHSGEIEKALIPVVGGPDAGLAARAKAEGMQVHVTSYGGSGLTMLSDFVDKYRRCKVPLWRSLLCHYHNPILDLPTVVVLADPVVAYASMRRRGLLEQNAVRMGGGTPAEAMWRFFSTWKSYAKNGTVFVKYEAMFSHLDHLSEHLGIPMAEFPEYKPRLTRVFGEVPAEVRSLREEWLRMPDLWTAEENY